MHNKLPHLAGLAFSVIFGLTFMFSKTVLEAGISPIGLIAYRYLIAFIVFEALRRVNIITITIERHHIATLFIVGIFQPVLYFIFETYGLQRTTSAEAGMMIALIPIMASVFSAILLKERPVPLQILFILLSVSGVIFIQYFNMRSGLEVQYLGLFLLFLAVVSAALFNIASRYAGKTLKAKEITYFMMLLGAVSFNGIYALSLLRQGDLGRYLGNLSDVTLIFPIAYLGIIASIGGFFLVNFSLSRLEVHVSSIYANIATIVAVIAGAVFLDEPIRLYHYIGAFMIVAGVYGTVRINREIARKRTQQQY